MRRLQAFALVSALLFSLPAFAQTNVLTNFRNSSGVATPVSPTQPLPITGSFSAGTFAPGGAYATLTATASSADVALPSGAAVIAFNTGTDAVSCSLSVGAGVAVASQNIIQANSWLGFSVGSNTHIACIDQTASTSNVVVISGGSGSPTGAGGGGGTAITNYALETGGNLAALLAAVQSPVPPGGNTIGNVNGAPNVTATDCSGSISSGGTAQNAFTAQTTLHGFTIVNIDTTEPLWISFTTTAAASTTGSYPLQAATATTFASPGSFTTPMGFGLNHALSVVAATTSHKWSCSWW